MGPAIVSPTEGHRPSSPGSLHPLMDMLEGGGEKASKDEPSIPHDKEVKHLLFTRTFASPSMSIWGIPIPKLTIVGEREK